jgi:hypothetical protein
MSFKQWADCKRFIDIGLSKVGGDNGNPYFHLFFRKLAFYYLLRETAEDCARAVDTVKVYLSRRMGMSSTSIDMYYYMGAAYYKLQNYPEAAAAFKECYNLIKACLAGQLDTTESSVVSSDYANEPGLMYVAQTLAEVYKKMLG